MILGNLGLGNGHPVRIQSMTSTSTMDIEATVAQVIRLVHAGCELVRISASNMQEARNLKNIRFSLEAKGIKTPLVADIHFQPKVAEFAATFVEKVRINPGNYSGSHHNKATKYSDADYLFELDETARKMKSLLNICRQQDTVIRIGINHGSLSDRILYRYGNTPQGMVASAMEFIEICRKNNFDKLILSLKASNVRTMIEANRLMVAEMKRYGYNYPIHLGVTEAGNGEEGRIKSAMGIGTLLSEGIGDTIRVSLTEPPENEIPVARQLVELFTGKSRLSPVSVQTVRFLDLSYEQRSASALFGAQPYHEEQIEILFLSYPAISFTELLLRAPVDFLKAYEKRKFHGLLIENGNHSGNLKPLSLQILQAYGLRYSKTEFVACPSCGRTLFDIEKKLEEVKKRLGNYKGLKIAIMGCLVNGPGEMAGADYGFVGASRGKVNLYKGEKIMYRNIPEEQALDLMEKLINEH